ncbi:hypothetical protein E2320_003508 [Naja naja]|nr:hypothetical protein E2320_003508 [Naja naja]
MYDELNCLKTTSEDMYEELNCLPKKETTFSFVASSKGSSQSDSVSQTPNNMEIIEGENAILPCDLKTTSFISNLMFQFFTMNLASFSLTLLVLISRNLLCHAKNPVQEPLLEVFNGRKTDLFCTHPNIQTNEYIFWYQQFPSQPPYFFVRGYQEPSKSIVGERVSLVVAHNRKNSTLSFTNVAFEDQALYFCALGDTVSHPRDSQSDSVLQTQSNVEILEGEDATLPCDFKATSSTPYLFWYRQYGNQKPEQILTAYKSKSSNNHFQEGKFSTTLVLESQNSVPLNIRSVSLLDAAVYFCALNPTVNNLCIQTHTKVNEMKPTSTLYREFCSREELLIHQTKVFVCSHHHYLEKVVENERATVLLTEGTIDLRYGIHKDVQKIQHASIATWCPFDTPVGTMAIQ